MDDAEREDGEMQYRSESREMELGNLKVEFSLFNGRLDEIERITTNQDLLDEDMYFKIGEKFISIKDYVSEKIQEIYG